MNASAAVAAGTLWHAARLAFSLPVARCDEIQAEFTGLVGRTTRASAGRVAQPTITYAPGDPTSTVLYGIVRDQVETFRARAASLRDREGLPRSVEREFRDFIRCGCLAGGFARFRCAACGQDRLVAFSCKGRGFCPTCGGRRRSVNPTRPSSVLSSLWASPAARAIVIYHPANAFPRIRASEIGGPVEFKYGWELDDGDFDQSRRRVLKSAAAIVGGSAAALIAREPALAQAPTPAVAAAEAQRQAPGKTAGMKFRALVRHDNSLSTETLTLRPIHPQQVVIRNQAAQACYTTTNALDTTNRPANANVAGHGGVGIVEEIGSQVKRVQVGDQVVMSITPQCGACANCLNGRADICSMFGRPLIPSAAMSDGTPVMMANGPSGYAEYLVTWEEFVVPVFTKVPPAELSLLACVSACGLGMAMCRFPVDAGSDVAVFGLGPVGLSAVQGARIQGATTIVGIDPIKYRRDLALKLGATAVLDPNADKATLITKIQSLTGDAVPQGRLFAGQRRGAGPMYVLEAVGGTRFPLPPTVESPTDMTGVEALQQCYTVVRGGGYLRTCSVGHPTGATVTFPAAGWANSSKTHVPGNFAGVQALRDIPRFVKLIERGLFDAKSLVGRTFRVDKMREALQVAADRSSITSVIDFT